MQINQSLYPPGVLRMTNAGRNLPLDKSVWGNRNKTICPSRIIEAYALMSFKE